MRVTGGFLAGLDINFSSGLNVVIGARGAGKTTLLELLRHALGAQNADQTRNDRQRQLIRSLLGDGEVVLDLEDDDKSHRLVVDAQGGGQRAEFTSAALVLGQNELETIADSPANRLALIDLRANRGASRETSSHIGVLTKLLAEARTDLTDMEERLKQRPLLEQDYEALRQQESQLLERSTEDLTTNRATLHALEETLLQAQQQRRHANQLGRATVSILSAVDQLNDQLSLLLATPAPQGIDAEAAISATLRDLTTVRARITSLRDASEAADKTATSRELTLRNEIEPVRADLESAERGMGELTSRLRGLQIQLGELAELQSEFERRSALYVATKARRNSLLDEVEVEGEEIYESRVSIAEGVSTALGGRVLVSVEHLANSSAFRDFLNRRLQGSKLRYAALAEAISRTVLPRQLLEQIETNRAEQLASAASIPIDRAARIIDYLQDPLTLAELASLNLEDQVDFLLRDGATTKRVEELSTGQKCAATLPVLMTEHTRTIVLDQPEDHLDNAYLVANVVTSIKRRSEAGAQSIVASHNANIPVLGGADCVLSLSSDGRQGFVEHYGSFEEPSIVADITRLMEGGREAFARRATFYSSHGTDG